MFFFSFKQEKKLDSQTGHVSPSITPWVLLCLRLQGSPAGYSKRSESIFLPLNMIASKRKVKTQRGDLFCRVRPQNQDNCVKHLVADQSLMVSPRS